MRGNRFRLAGLVSASGSTAARIYQACQEGELDAEMPLIITNHDGAGDRLKKLPHPPRILVISRQKFATREAFNAVVADALDEAGIDHAGLWGWDPLVLGELYMRYAASSRMHNQHPHLTPWFGGEGMNGVIPVCAGLNFARATGHEFVIQPISQWVHKQADLGDIIKSGWVDIYTDDTCETLYERVKLEEHRVQIETVQDAISGALRKHYVNCPVREGEEGMLAAAKAQALAHHANKKQSELKSTKG